MRMDHIFEHGQMPDPQNEKMPHSRGRQVDDGRQETRESLQGLTLDAKARPRSKNKTSDVDMSRDNKHWNKETKEMVAGLRAGKVPPYVAETLRLVPFESPEGRAFHTFMLAFVKNIYEKHAATSNGHAHPLARHDFDRHPVRFMLSKETGANACFVRYSAPPIIVLNEGLFRTPAAPGRPAAEPVVANPDELCLMACHEMTHLKMRMQYGDIRNSVWEEALAYSLPLTLAHSAGLNPEKAEHCYGKLYGGTRGKRTGLMEIALDEHPAPENMPLVTSTALAHLRGSRGSLAPADPAPAFTEQSEPVRIAKEAAHTSFVASHLPGDFKELPLADRFRILGDTVEIMAREQLIPIRSSDLLPHFRDIKSALAGNADTGVHVLADRILALCPARPDLFRFYEIFCSPDIIPGRLAPLRAAAQELVTTTEQGDEDAILDAADALNGLAAAEPLVSNAATRDLLMRLPWPQFPFPDIEKVERVIRLRKKGKKVARETVSWQPLIPLAHTDPRALKAALLMNLGEDIRLYHSPSSGSQKQMAFAYAEFFCRGGRGAFVPPPSDGSTDIRNLSLTPEGRVSKLDVLHTEVQKRNLGVSRRAVIGGAAAQAIEEMVEELHGKKPDEDQIRMLTALRDLHDGQEFICPALLEENSTLFMLLNERTLSFSEPCIAQFLATMTAWLSDDRKKGIAADIWKSDQLRGIIQIHFTESFGEETLDSGTGNRGSSESEEADEYEDMSGEEAIGRHACNGFFGSPYWRWLQEYGKDFLNSRELWTVQTSLMMATVGGAVSMCGKYSARIVSEATPAAAGGIGLKNLGYASLLQAWHTLPALPRPDASAWKENPELLKLYYERSSERGVLDAFMHAAFLRRPPPAIEQIVALLEARDEDSLSEQTKLLLAKILQRAGQKILSLQPLSSQIVAWSTFHDLSVLAPDVDEKLQAELAMRIGGVTDARERLELYGRYLNGRRIADPQLRAKVLNGVASACFILQGGKDDGSLTYAGRLLSQVDTVLESLHRGDWSAMLSTLAKLCETQQETSAAFYERSQRIQRQSEDLAIALGIGANTLLAVAPNNPKVRSLTLDFFLSPASPVLSLTFARAIHEETNINLGESDDIRMMDTREQNEAGLLDRVSDYGQDKDRQNHKLFRTRIETRLRRMHENFWALPLEARAIVARELLLPAAHDDQIFNRASFDEAVKRTFSQPHEHQGQVRQFMEHYTRAQPHYMRHLTLGAMMSAFERTRHKDARLGQAIALFAERSGPAQTKEGQVAACHPDVPDDIRHDLERLKFAADEPDRWEVLQWVESAKEDIVAKYDGYLGQAGMHKGNDLDPQGRAYIKRRGKVIGSGSLYVAIKLEMSDGRAYVLDLLRPFALERARDGFDISQTMTGTLAAENPRGARTTQEIIAQAQRKLGPETDCEIAPEQYGKGVGLYRWIQVTADGRTFECDAAAAPCAGKGWFLMEKMEGTHFAELPEGTDEEKAHKQSLRKAILTLELHHILHGTFDNDRHGGNIKVSGNSIRHFDFKATSLEQWSPQGYDQFARLLLSVIQNVGSPEELSPLLMKEEAAMRAEGIDVDPFIPEVQKALLSLGEYTRGLTPEDFKEVLFSALSMGMHPDMESALLGRIGQSAFKDIQGEVKTFLDTGKVTGVLAYLVPKNRVSIDRRLAG